MSLLSLYPVRFSAQFEPTIWREKIYGPVLNCTLTTSTAAPCPACSVDLPAARSGPRDFNSAIARGSRNARYCFGGSVGVAAGGWGAAAAGGGGGSAAGGGDAAAAGGGAAGCAGSTAGAATAGGAGGLGGGTGSAGVLAVRTAPLSSALMVSPSMHSDSSRQL